MSLVKRPRMTEKRLAALQENRKHARGPATAEGRERIRSANLRHGFYSKAGEEALRALGEDPADFRELLEGLLDKKTMGDTLQQRIALRMARALWRMDRADRMLDGHALRKAQEQEYARDGRLHMQMMRLKITSRSWQWLAQAVARDHYVTSSAELEMMRNLHKEGVAKEMSEVALALFYQLRRPGLPGPGDPNFEDEEQQEQQRRVLERIKAIFGIGDTPPLSPEVMAANRAALREQGHAVDPEPAAVESSSSAIAITAEAGGQEAGQAEPPSGMAPDSAYPEVTEAQWLAREPIRQLLENLLTRQVQLFESQHHKLLRQSVKGPYPYERAVEIVPTHPDTRLVQKLENSNLRQLLRMSNLIIRLRRQERQMEAAATRPAVSRDVEQNKDT